MKTLGWIVVESLILPQWRERLPVVYKLIEHSRIPEAGMLLVEHIHDLEKILGRTFLETDEDLKVTERSLRFIADLSMFLVDNKDSFKSRLNAINLRTREETIGD